MGVRLLGLPHLACFDVFPDLVSYSSCHSRSTRPNARTLSNDTTREKCGSARCDWSPESLIFSTGRATKTRKKKEIGKQIPLNHKRARNDQVCSGKLTGKLVCQNAALIMAALSRLMPSWQLLPSLNLGTYGSQQTVPE